MISEFSNDKLVSYIQNNFNHSADFTARKMDWDTQTVIICYYSSIVDKAELNEELAIIKNNWFSGNHAGESFTTMMEAFRMERLREIVSLGDAGIIFPEDNLLMVMGMAKTAVRSPSEPQNEQVIRGLHEGFVESIDTNIALLRKHYNSTDLVFKKYLFGEEKKLAIALAYVKTKAEKEVVELVEKKIKLIEVEDIGSNLQIFDYIEENVWSPFPQLLNTERPDRVVANLDEGKIAIFSGNSPTALITPTTFISYYQSIDDFNSRPLIGSFYRMIRLFGFFTAILLPGFYIAVVSYHPEIIPIELYKKIKQVADDIPYRPILEALILEVMIELIREAGIRLPSPIGQTIGIVGGLVIGDAIVNAGLVSNLMIIVVALTALASFVVPSPEMNTAIRLLRFPFMIAASFFGFLGLAIGSILLYIHMLNLSSLKQPYLSPFIPFQPKEFKKVFFRLPYEQPRRQTDNFKVPSDQKDNVK